MPHYKCATCKIRVRISGAPAEQFGDHCPGCGSLLEPADDLADLIGFRTMERLDGSADDLKALPHQSIANRVDGFVSRRAELLERERDVLEAERWLDDANLIAATAALPVPETVMSGACPDRRRPLPGHHGA